MAYKIGVTTSPEYPVRIDKFLDGLAGSDVIVEEINMPFRELTREETTEIIPRLAPYVALLSVLEYLHPRYCMHYRT